MSKIKSFLILLSSVMLMPSFSNAQAPADVVADTLVWKARTINDSVTDTSQVNSSEFVTYGTSKIVWIQNGGDAPAVFEFNVTNIDNHWAGNGYAVYSTTRKNKVQSFRFEHAGSEIRIKMTYSDTGGNRTLIFIIDEVSPLPD